MACDADGTVHMWDTKPHYDEVQDEYLGEGSIIPDFDDDYGDQWRHLPRGQVAEVVLTLHSAHAVPAVDENATLMFAEA